METRAITVAGSVLVDRLNEIAAYPKAGELTQIRAVGRAPGGCVPNVAIDLKRFAPGLAVSAAGKVGADDDGAFACAEMARAGVDVAQVLRTPGETTSFTDVMTVPGGERTFFTFPGASAAWGYDDVDFGRFGPGDVVHLGYFLLLAKVDAGDGLRILRELKRRGATTSIDLVTENSSRYALVRECLPYVDNLVVNEIEAARLAGTDGGELRAAAERLRALGVRERVVVHLPEKGVLLSPRGWCERPSARLPPEAIRGKTGAGDAFCAGALAGIARGAGDEEILELGSVAAAGAMRAPGATEGMATEKELRDYVGQFE